MKYFSFLIRGAGIACAGWSLSCAGQTATWNWQARGQTVGDSCSIGGNVIKSSVTYPNNTNWSQGNIYGVDPCGNPVVIAPANWTPAVVPTGPTFDVILGNQGGNIPRLDINVNLHSLTILSTGGLIMGSGTLLTASNIDLQGDVTVIGDGGPVLPALVSPGLLRKSGGTGSATLAVGFTNQNGSIEVDTGTLNIGANKYFQGGGALTFRLGGTGSGQSGQLVCGPARLNGPLIVTLTNGFVPAGGVEIQVVNASSVIGTFTSVNIPAGLSVSYRTDGVFLVSGGGPAGVLILAPQRSGANFIFSFQTTLSQSYTVQQSTNLGTTNWQFFSNVIGNGSVFQFSVPISTGAPGRFFRVREP
jgi:hypothetical protein